MSLRPGAAGRRRQRQAAVVAAAGVLAGGMARAQTPDLMDDDVRWFVAADELEWSASGGERTVRWAADLWAGTDLNRFWLKTDGERSGSDTGASDVQLLYSRAMAPFWDLQAGLRHAARPSPAQNWAVVGVQGLAPYWYEVEASMAVADGGRRRLHARASYELLLTQRLILEPEAEVTFYSSGDPPRLIGDSLSEFEFGVRLRYEWRREIAPYVGIVRQAHIGATADLYSDRGLATRHTQFVVGLRAWY